MDRVLIVDVDNCTGCKACELVCSLYKHGEHNPSKSYIWVARNYEMDVNIPLLAVQCDPNCIKCVEYCPTQCLQFVSLPEGAVLRKGTKIGSMPAPLFSRPVAQS